MALGNCIALVTVALLVGTCTSLKLANHGCGHSCLVNHNVPEGKYGSMGRVALSSPDFRLVDKFVREQKTQLAGTYPNGHQEAMDHRLCRKGKAVYGQRGDRI